MVKFTFDDYNLVLSTPRRPGDRTWQRVNGVRSRTMPACRRW